VSRLVESGDLSDHRSEEEKEVWLPKFEACLFGG
jgi:hypothetical protein